MGTVEEGAKIAVEKCMKVTDTDKVLIIADEPSKGIGMSIRKFSLDITKYVRFFNIDLPKYGGRPIQRFPEGLEEALRESTVTFFVAGAQPGELPTLREPFLRMVSQIKARHAHMVGVTNDIMGQGMCADYDIVQTITEKVYEMVRFAREIKVTSPAGTDFTAYLDVDWYWIKCPGVITEQGEWDNLPSGEVYTAPKGFEGRLVVDGTIGDWLGDKYKDIIDFKETPLIVDVSTENGGAYITNVECANKELLDDFNEYVGSERNASRVGELGIGTNIFLKDVIGNILQDEKLPTVHVAFGDPYSAKTKAPWSSDHHIDLLMMHCSIWVDGKQIMDKGDYLEEFKNGY